MKNIKHIISIFIDCLLISNIIPLISFADDDYTFKYTISDNTVSIYDCVGEGKNIYIPDYIENLPVTSIEVDTFQNFHTFETIYIGSYIENINDGTFSSCTNLQKIEVSSQNQYLCTINDSLYSKDGKSLIHYAGSSDYAVISDGTERIENTAFFGSTNITEVYIPNSVSYIGNYSFTGCMNLKSIEIPDNVKEIGKGCFFSCTYLENVRLSQNLETIYDETFYACLNLKKIIIPSSVKEIETDAFYTDKNFCFYGFYNSITEKYANEKNTDFHLMGNVNDDEYLNSSDASTILLEYASISAGLETSFDETQIIIADYNIDGEINSSDASAVLSEYAKLSSGN